MLGTSRLRLQHHLHHHLRYHQRYHLPTLTAMLLQQRGELQAAAVLLLLPVVVAPVVMAPLLKLQGKTPLHNVAR